jgi:tetratricopeptide (TPR) repeat protein
MALANYPRAEEIFRRGNELAPKDPVFLVYLARLENASDRLTEAKAHLLQALKYDPDLANNLKSDAPELIPLLNELKKNG